MEAKIPTHLLKPRYLCDVPRSKYVIGPELKANDEKSRTSFISLLRKGPTNRTSKTQLPSSITIHCALWISLNKPINTCVSLILHCKEYKSDYCLVLDETRPENSETLMLSGTAVIHPKTEIDFIHISCSGISSDYHVLVNDIHIDSEINTTSEELRKIG